MAASLEAVVRRSLAAEAEDNSYTALHRVLQARGCSAASV